MMRPPVSDVKRFLEVLDALDNFEGHCRASRGYGAFNVGQKFPIPEVVRVTTWLKSIMKDDADYLVEVHTRLAMKNSTLREAAQQFLFYAENHFAKTPPDTAKAKVNSEWAIKCAAAADLPIADVPTLAAFMEKIKGVDKSVNNGEK